MEWLQMDVLIKILMQDMDMHIIMKIYKQLCARLVKKL